MSYWKMTMNGAENLLAHTCHEYGCGNLNQKQHVQTISHSDAAHRTLYLHKQERNSCRWLLIMPTRLHDVPRNVPTLKFFCCCCVGWFCTVLELVWFASVSLYVLCVYVWECLHIHRICKWKINWNGYARVFVEVVEPNMYWRQSIA